jgi:hypothetical protein
MDADRKRLLIQTFSLSKECVLAPLVHQFISCSSPVLIRVHPWFKCIVPAEDGLRVNIRDSAGYSPDSERVPSAILQSSFQPDLRWLCQLLSFCVMVMD